jgi:hypothetical protein
LPCPTSPAVPDEARTAGIHKKSLHVLSPNQAIAICTYVAPSVLSAVRVLHISSDRFVLESPVVRIAG